MTKIILIVLFLLTIPSVYAQTKPSANDVRPTNCELVQRILSTVHELTPNRNLIIISRLGDYETSHRLHQIRLNSARKYLESVWKRQPDTIVLAAAAKTKGLGRLELYVNGDLSYVIYAKRKNDIASICNLEP